MTRKQDTRSTSHSRRRASHNLFSPASSFEGSTTRKRNAHTHQPPTNYTTDSLHRLNLFQSRAPKRIFTQLSLFFCAVVDTPSIKKKKLLRLAALPHGRFSSFAVDAAPDFFASQSTTRPGHAPLRSSAASRSKTRRSRRGHFQSEHRPATDRYLLLRQARKSAACLLAVTACL